MKDTEEGTGRQWKWIEERNIVGEYDEGYRGGGNEGAGGSK